MGTIARINVIPLASYANGSRIFGGAVIDDAATIVYIELQRCTTANPTIWPSAACTVSLDIEIGDGGPVWTFIGGFKGAGGIIVQHNGEEGTITAFFCPLPVGVSRHIRAQITIAGGPLRTQGFLELRN